MIGRARLLPWLELAANGEGGKLRCSWLITYNHDNNDNLLAKWVELLCFSEALLLSVITL